MYNNVFIMSDFVWKSNQLTEKSQQIILLIINNPTRYLRLHVFVDIKYSHFGNLIIEFVCHCLIQLVTRISMSHAHC